MPPSPLSFPVLSDELADRWQWPAPPFAWRHDTPIASKDGQPCRVEAPRGVTVDGHMMDFRPQQLGLIFRSPTTGPAGRLSFARFRRLTLTTPLERSPAIPGAPAEGVPAAAQERAYRLGSNDGEPPLTGRTAGHVETDEGLFLFTPDEDERSLMRVFVPRTAYVDCHFGRSAQEIAAERWIVTPQELLAALEHQQRMPVRRIGQSLLDLGLVTPRQLERALEATGNDVPLGERLVARGVISRSDLQTALAHKMGYPLVDLARFPADPAAAELLPSNLAARYHALPLMSDKRRVIVAVDRPQRVIKLQALSKFSGLKLVPVLASKSELLLALARRTQRDPWSQHVAGKTVFFATTV